MLRPWVCLATLILAVSALPRVPNQLPEPGDLALYLNEEEFEDYLDAWLAVEEQKWVNASISAADTRSGCSFRINGDLGSPQPVYIKGNTYLAPSGTSGQIQLKQGEEIIIACTGSGRSITHPNVISSVNTGTVKCAANDQVTASWLRGNSNFRDLKCSSNSYHDAQATNQKCYNNNLVIQVGFIVSGKLHPLYWSCFDQNTLEVLYVWYEQTPENLVHESGVTRPSFIEGGFYPNVNTNNLYTQVTQKATLAKLVGQDLADKYITNTQFLARGHLAAKSDYIYATGQRASFYFINCAPQWQPFNGGNWNYLEQNLRSRIGAAGYRTTIYTGTFGVTQLKDQNNKPVDFYLHTDANNNGQLPVPLYFYKVVYDSSRRVGTAFISINNPYVTLAEARDLQFCTDRCRNNSAFNWLRWAPDRIEHGYSFCCTIDEFRRKIPHLPSFSVNGLLT